MLRIDRRNMKNLRLVWQGFMMILELKTNVAS